jgi:(S)-ureidoglycine aminohydrolase
MPFEGFPISRLPSWPNAQVKVLASPALGARFVQYLIELPSDSVGTFEPDETVETFVYVLSGIGRVLEGGSGNRQIREGGYGLFAPGESVGFAARGTPLRLLVLRKRYEAAGSVQRYATFFGHESDVKKEVWADNPNSLLQALIPDELQYDMAMNIFTFSPGYGLPIIETHVMEHGLLFLEGKGLYYLDGEWMEVEKDDFIWMGPYCPQSFYATGPTPAKYIYYKNVNREIPL